MRFLCVLLCAFPLFAQVSFQYSWPDTMLGCPCSNRDTLIADGREVVSLHHGDTVLNRGSMSGDGGFFVLPPVQIQPGILSGYWIQIESYMCCWRADLSIFRLPAGFVSVRLNYFNWQCYDMICDNVGAVNEKPIVPRYYAVLNCYPNPFNGSTTLALDLPNTQRVKIEIFDVLGRTVDVLANERLSAGHHTFRWETSYPSGIYFARAVTQNETMTVKLLLMK
jgi:hypothetical protein